MPLLTSGPYNDFRFNIKLFQVPLLTSGPCIVMALNYYMSLVMFNITLSDTTSYVWSLYYDGFKLLYEMSFMLIKLFQVPLLTSGPCIVMALNYYMSFVVLNIKLFQVPLLTSGPCIVMALNYYMSFVMLNIKLFQVPLLTSGPCIVMALQRDNAVLVFDSIMGR